MYLPLSRAPIRAIRHAFVSSRGDQPPQVLNGLVVPLLRTHFYATESEPFKHRVLFFRKPVWAAAASDARRSLVQTLKLQRVAEATARRLLDTKQALGVARVRLVPKATGMRPIMDLSLRRSVLPRHRAVVTRGNGAVTAAGAGAATQGAQRGALVDGRGVKRARAQAPSASATVPKRSATWPAAGGGASVPTAPAAGNLRTSATAGPQRAAGASSAGAAATARPGAIQRSVNAQLSDVHEVCLRVCVLLWAPRACGMPGLASCQGLVRCGRRRHAATAACVCFTWAS